MKAVVTGAAGLVGSEAVKKLLAEGYEVVGIENGMRAQFFGREGSTAPMAKELRSLGAEIGMLDIRDRSGVERLFKDVKPDLVIHTAAQPSHDWAAGNPHVDFGVNATGTLTVVEAARQSVPDSPFCHISTSKVYGDTPNRLPLRPDGPGRRLDLSGDHPYFNGIDTTMSIDQSLHSLFGVSKIAGDLIVQEYGRYFGMPTICFRPGCITGPAHAGVELHGFLAYLMKCVATERPYTVYGYGGLQVRCNIYAADLVEACLAFAAGPVESGCAYNIGGGRKSACSMLEAITACEVIAKRELDYTISDDARIGDHRWWISDIADFQADYPGWAPTLDVVDLLREIHDKNVEQWTA